MKKKSNNNDSSSAQIPPEFWFEYWLTVCNGMEAVEAFITANTHEEELTLLEKYPVLITHEFSETMKWLANKQANRGQRALLNSKAESLKEIQNGLADDKMVGLLFDLAAQLLLDESGGERIINLYIAIDIYEKLREQLRSDSQGAADCMTNEGLALTDLAKLGEEPKKNLENAIDLYEQALRIFDPKSPDAATCMMDEGLALIDLAELGEEPKKNLVKAIDLYEQALRIFDQKSPDAAGCMIDEGLALTDLAELGEEPKKNLVKAIGLYEQALRIFDPKSPSAARCMANEGIALANLAKLGEEPKKNLEKAIDLYEQALRIFDSKSPDAAGCMMNEGLALAELAKLGEEPKKNLVKAIDLYEKALRLFDPKSPDAAGCMMDEGIALTKLAELGEEPKKNLENAIDLYEQALSIFDPKSPSAARCMMNEGLALTGLAELGEEPKKNLEKAIDLYEQVLRIFDPKSPDAAGCMMNEGAALIRLAELGAEPKKNIGKAIDLYEQALRLFDPKSPDAARCMMDEGTALTGLAELGAEPKKNLEKAIDLYEQALRIFDSKSPSAARCMANEGIALAELAELGEEPKKNLEEAIDLYKNAYEIFKDTGSNLHAIKVLGNLGKLYLTQKRDFTKALGAFKQAIEVIDTIRGNIKLIQDKQAFMEQNMGIFSGAVKACLKLGLYEEALEYVEKGRSRALLDLLYTEDAKPKNCSDELINEYKKAIKRAEELEVELAKESKGRSGGRFDSNRGIFTKAHYDEEKIKQMAEKKAVLLKAIQKYEQQIRDKDPDYFIAAKPPEIEEIKNIARNIRRAVIVPWIGKDNGALFFISREGKFAYKELKEINDKVIRKWMFGDDGNKGWIGAYEQFIKALNKQEESEALLNNWLGQMETILAELSERVTGPLQEQLSEWKEERIAFVPGGYLGLLPLHAMKLDGGHLIDRYDVIYAPSAWILGRSEKRSGIKGGNWSILGIENSSLDFAEKEINGIKGLFGDHKVESLKDTNKEGLAEKLPKHQIAHFSCHGMYESNEPLQSALQLNPDSFITLGEIIGRIDTNELRFAVLSACETGIGYKGFGSEEYLGIPAGFMFAGAKAVIGSLWSVNDVATAMLMIKVYEGLKEGKELSEALRCAQVWLKRLTIEEARKEIEGLAETENGDELTAKLRELGGHPFSHPYWWAGFQVIGVSDKIVLRK